MAKFSQHPLEIQRLCDVIAGVGSILEVGSRYGEALLRFADAAKSGAKIVSVDLPDGMWGRSDSQPYLENVVALLNEKKYDASLILGDSHQPDIIDEIKSHGAFDFVFIDGDHTYEGVKQDYDNYASLGKIVAFHDVNAWGATLPDDTPLGVPQFWSEIKKKVRCYEEFSYTPQGLSPMGIGIIWDNYDK